jgi:uncharacterized protein (DUF2147 family)
VFDFASTYPASEALPQAGKCDRPPVLLRNRVRLLAALDHFLEKSASGSIAMRTALAVELVVTVALISTLALGAERSTTPIEGPWLTEDRGGVIDIEPCGSLHCGRIIGLAAASSGNPPPKDVNGNSRCGLEIIQGLAETDPGEWTGKITNPDDGQVYSARLSVDDRGRLRLRGYVLVPLLGQTQIWTRYGGRVTANCRMLPADRPKMLTEQPHTVRSASLSRMPSDGQD